MSAETKTDRVLRDVLNSDNLRDLLSEDVFDNAMRWRFLQAALYVLDGHGLLGDPDAVKDATPATPAPLDPSLVKAGDTVTLESGTALVRDVVIEARSRGAGQFVFYTGENPDPLIPGTYYLVNSGAWTLTDHQPAPEPEPEWKPGTTGTAHIVSGDATTKDGRVFRKMRGMVVHRPAPIDDDMFVTVEGELWGLEGEYCKNFVPDEPRPLPTWAEIHNAIAANLPADIDSLRKMTDDIEALLRGESR